MICSKCGKEITGGYDFCMNCGVKIDHEEIQKAAYKAKNKKLIITSIIAVIVVITIGITIFAISNYSRSRNGLYKNIAWETSMRDIKKIVVNDTDIGNLLYEESDSVCYELKNFSKVMLNMGELNLV